MREQAERIRALLRSGDWEQESQGRELLRALGDGALYAEVLAGWRWSSGLLWDGEGWDPFSEHLAAALWLDAPLDAPFSPELAPGRAEELWLRWDRAADQGERAHAPAAGKLARLPGLREVKVILDAASPPFPFAALPRSIRTLRVRGAQGPGDLAGLAALGAPRLALESCALGGGALPLPPRLAELTLRSCGADLDLGEALAGSSLRHLELFHMPRARSLAKRAWAEQGRRIELR